MAADLDILEQGLSTRPLQLAIAGTGPALFLQDIVENTDFDGLVLIGVTPFLFNRLDEGFFGEEAYEEAWSEVRRGRLTAPGVKDEDGETIEYKWRIAWEDTGIQWCVYANGAFDCSDTASK